MRDAWTKQRPFPHRGFCCPVGSSGTTAASDALPAHRPLPGSTGYRTRRSSSRSRRPPGRGGPPQFPLSPSERSVPHTPGGSSGLRFQALHPFHGLRPDDPGSAPPLPHPQAGWLTTRQASLDATDRSVAPPQGLSTLGFDRPVTRPSRQPATGPPGSYPDGTHTRRRRRAYVRIRSLDRPPPNAGHTPRTWCNSSVVHGPDPGSA